MRSISSVEEPYINPDALFLAAIVPERAIENAPRGAPYERELLHEYWKAAIHILNDPTLETTNHKRIEARETLIVITKAVNEWIDKCREEAAESPGTEGDGWAREPSDRRSAGQTVNNPEHDDIHWDGADQRETPLQRASHVDPQADWLVAQGKAIQARGDRAYYHVPGAWPASPEIQSPPRGIDPAPMTIGSMVQTPDELHASESWNDSSGTPRVDQRRHDAVVYSHGDSRTRARDRARRSESMALPLRVRELREAASETDLRVPTSGLRVTNPDTVEVNVNGADSIKMD